MTARWLRFLVIGVIAISVLSVAQPAAAAGIVFNQFLSVGCANAATGFQWTITGTGGAPYDVRTIVWQGDKVYMDEIVPGLTGDITWPWHLYNSNSGGTQNTLFPLEPNTFTNVSLSAAGATITFNFVCAGTPVSGPPIPPGFVLRNITCDTAIFDRPAGEPVGNNRISAGQTWYINPTPTAPDANGRRWTEIFVSGLLNGYIPAECVGGQEALRPVAVAGLPSGGNGVTRSAVAGGAPSVSVASAVLGGGANGQTTTNAVGQTVYTVTPGDRLYRIALRFGVSLGALAAANGIGNLNLIYPGQQLIIPA